MGVKEGFMRFFAWRCGFDSSRSDAGSDFGGEDNLDPSLSDPIPGSSFIFVSSSPFSALKCRDVCLVARFLFNGCACDFDCASSGSSFIASSISPSSFFNAKRDSALLVERVTRAEGDAEAELRAREVSFDRREVRIAPSFVWFVRSLNSRGFARVVR